ncbi:Hypothetical predicted protein [Paramuricea clavata]|uniref:Uncharacterized protein n=1 Tax=Paramuricea clavata TaxID=317549 RepID=A0A6S7GJI0_PARCT|nr:Hypothetical predicted protein [Paramuricea clavata]
MLFLRVNKVAVQLFCIALFCFVFLAHSAHGQTATTKAAMFVTPSNVITSAINNASDAVLKSGSSTFIPTISIANVSNTAVPLHISTVSPTDKPPKTTVKYSPKDTGRKFDGLSFFGGMILGAVVCVALLFSVKYYQAKKRSYHSL